MSNKINGRKFLSYSSKTLIINHTWIDFFFFFFFEKKNLIKYIYACIIKYIKSFYHYNKMKNLFLFLFFLSFSLSILFDYQHTYFCFLFLIVYIFIWYNWNNFNIFLTNKLFQEDYCLIKYIMLKLLAYFV